MCVYIVDIVRYEIVSSICYLISTIQYVRSWYLIFRNMTVNANNDIFSETIGLSWKGIMITNLLIIGLFVDSFLFIFTVGFVFSKEGLLEVSYKLFSAD